MLIVFEGIDGSGKTTQVRLLAEALQRMGFRVAILSEPSDSEYGDIIRTKLKSGDYTAEELYNLFLSDRIYHADLIKKLLEDGYIVIMDRYYFSTIAYQGAQGIPIEKIIMDHKDLPQPDLVIVLDLDPKLAIRRIDEKDTFERVDFLNRVRKVYLNLPNLIKNIDIVILDANQPTKKLHETILSLVLERVKSKDA